MFKTITTLVLILCIGRIAAFCTITNENITEELKNCEQPINKLKLQNASLIQIPSQISDANRDISFIDISGVGLKSMESASFCQFKRIVAIDFSNNSLTKLPKQMLSECEPHLNDLNFSFNKITELTDDIFIKLTSLEKIDLSSNFIERLVDDVFKPLAHLMTLRLNNNRISIIDDDLFAHNSNLITLTLNNNMLAAIDNSSFNGLKQLRAIELGNNPMLKVIDFSGMDRLQRVQIENCSLSVLHVPAHGKIIIAHKNNISHIKIGQENELEILDLSMNHILNLRDLSSLIHLKELDLSNNELVEINFSHLAPLTNLTRFNIYGNPIKSLDCKALTQYLTSIREIGISDNSLDNVNLEKCTELMRLNNIKLSLINESESISTNPSKSKKTATRSLPRPPLISDIQEIDILRRLEYLEDKEKQYAEQFEDNKYWFSVFITVGFCTFVANGCCYAYVCYSLYSCGRNLIVRSLNSRPSSSRRSKRPSPVSPPSNPVPSNSDPSNPGPSNPGPSNLDPSNPGPSNLDPSNPGPSSPGPSNPASSNSDFFNPGPCSSGQSNSGPASSHSLSSPSYSLRRESSHEALINVTETTF